MDNKKYVFIGAAIVIILLILTGSKKTGNDEYKIGIIAPISGDAASYGEVVRDVTALAEEEINKEGVNGKKIKLIVQDGKCNGPDALNAAKQLIDVEQVKVIIGGACSGESLAILPELERGKVAAISTISSSPDLTGKSAFFARNWPSDTEQGGALAEHVINVDKLKKVGLIHEQTDYAAGLARVFEEKAVAASVGVIKEVYAKDSTDFKTQIAKLQSENVEGVVVVAQTAGSGARLIKQMADLGIKTKLYVTEVFLDDAILADNKAVLEGAVAATFSLPTTDPNIIKLDQAFKAKYNKDTPFLNSIAVTSYDAVYLVKEAILKAGYDGDAIAKYFRTVQDYKGYSGNITINNQGDRVGTKMVYKKITDGKAVEIK